MLHPQEHVHLWSHKPARIQKTKKKHSSTTVTPELLVQTIQDCNRPVPIDSLLKILHLPRAAKNKVELLLAALQEQGKIIRSRGTWHSPKQTKQITGVLSLHKSGAGFVTASDDPENTLFISPADMGDAWSGDTVTVMLLPGRRQGQHKEGRITQVVHRAQRLIPVSAIKLQGTGEWACTPFNQGIQTVFMVTASDTPVAPKDLLLITPLEKIAHGVWSANLATNLEHENTPMAQELLAKNNHAIPSLFPATVLAEALALPNDPQKEDFAGYQDLRDVQFVTIDGEDAKDFDDAVHVEPLATGYRLRVAIADVAHYVQPGSALDHEAFERGNSYYFPLSVEPMLPEALSNGLCSLRPDVPRLTMVADMTFDQCGKEMKATFYPAVIMSKARLTYGAVHAALLNNDTKAQQQLSSVLPMLTNAMELAKTLASMRKHRGSLEFDLPEVLFQFDAQNTVQAVTQRTRNFAHQLIEEFMVAANEAVARFLTAKKIPLLYRAHPAPKPEKIESLVLFLEKTGLVAFSDKPRQTKKEHWQPTALDLSSLLESVKGTSQEYTINRLTLRSMMQAKYTPEHDGHFGLASTCYCHFTSPIRRYADLVVHRALKQALTKTPALSGNLQSIADQINKTERSAMEAERETQKRLTILFMQDKIDEEYDGIVSGVTDFGIFVEIPRHLAEGMIRLSSLSDDYYEYFPEQHMLRGSRRGQTFSLGQKVTVRLTDVSLSRLEINFVLAGTAPQNKRPVQIKKNSKKSAPACATTKPHKKNKQGTTKNTAKNTSPRSRPSGSQAPGKKKNRSSLPS